jgi:hypothetical protein
MQAQRSRPAQVRRVMAGHRWVGAALVELGLGANDRRAEHAARTGRHVVTPGTRIDVLEVYCADCRAPYTKSADEPCPKRAASRAG